MVASVFIHIQRCSRYLVKWKSRLDCIVQNCILVFKRCRYSHRKIPGWTPVGMVTVLHHRALGGRFIVFFTPFVMVGLYLSSEYLLFCMKKNNTFNWNVLSLVPSLRTEVLGRLERCGAQRHCHGGDGPETRHAQGRRWAIKSERTKHPECCQILNPGSFWKCSGSIWLFQTPQIQNL